MPSRNRRPNSAQLWGLDDATAMRPQIKPPRPRPVSTQVTDVVPAPSADERDGGGLVLLLSVEDAGRALGVSRSTVYELISSGDLEVVHVRRSVRVPVDAIHDFVRRLRADRAVTDPPFDRTMSRIRP
jgi:excisionase family DNA binding protein